MKQDEILSEIKKHQDIINELKGLRPEQGDYIKKLKKLMIEIPRFSYKIIDTDLDKTVGIESRNMTSGIWWDVDLNRAIAQNVLSVHMRVNKGELQLAFRFK